MHHMDQLGALMAQISRQYDRWAKQHGINYNILAVFYTLAVQGPCTQKQIGESWQLPKQTVFSVCRQLHAQGYLSFGLSSRDKREKTLHFTAHGAAFALPIVEQMQAMERQLFENFGEQAGTRLIEEMHRFTDVLAQTMFADHQ
ncbi:MarR family winged helix-turn-helix transcriptional regulator [Uruburuella testudinis]|uniref:MarR family winged helix-turn-helix transcriptional regulator n=1 Tax=Uruburuella testudinis TaxID=1282863 RepID=A0ABY4DQW7_9NEIS|nr:MarR family winged helix-turn-helix transcriptional regulator [Uruburuella testudinis]UOO81338.1 MarR family winged helix-turn-helix transcriptional regulator [Uruburuella testudinis]